MEKIQDKALTASVWIWQSYRVMTIWQSLVMLWDTAEALWVSGNDASAPKPCLNPESSSDEGFVRSNAVVQTSVIVWYLYIYIYIYIYVHILDELIKKNILCVCVYKSSLQTYVNQCKYIYVCVCVLETVMIELILNNQYLINRSRRVICVYIIYYLQGYVNLCKYICMIYHFHADNNTCINAYFKFINVRTHTHTHTHTHIYIYKQTHRE